MERKVGLMPDTIVRLVKRDEELVDRIMIARDLEGVFDDNVRDMLRYNVWTVKQFKDLTGLAVSTIENKCRPIYKDGEIFTELDFCFPFGHLEGRGPKFIIRNEKSEALLPKSEEQQKEAINSYLKERIENSHDAV
jgi:hypothetical protein